MNQRALLLWLGGFAGVGLLYAAYKGQLNPIKAVASALNSQPAPATVGGQPTSNATGSVATSTGGVETAVAGNPGVVNSNGVYYVADQYGNPTTPIDGVYQGLPNNYIPNTSQAA